MSDTSGTVTSVSLSEFIGSNYSPSTKRLSIKAMSRKRYLVNCSTKVEWTAHQKYKRYKFLNSYQVPNISKKFVFQNVDEGLAVVGKQEIKSPPISPTLQKRKFNKYCFDNPCNMEEIYGKVGTNLSDEIVPEYPSRNCFLKHLAIKVPLLRRFHLRQFSAKLTNEIYDEAIHNMKIAIIDYLLMDEKFRIENGISDPTYESRSPRPCIRAPVPWRFQMNYVKTIFQEVCFAFDENIILMKRLWAQMFDGTLNLPFNQFRAQFVQFSMFDFQTFFNGYMENISSQIYPKYQQQIRQLLSKITEDKFPFILNCFEIWIFLQLRNSYYNNLLIFYNFLEKSNNYFNSALMEPDGENLLLNFSQFIHSWIFMNLKVVPKIDNSFLSANRFLEHLTSDSDLIEINKKITHLIEGFISKIPSVNNKQSELDLLNLSQYQQFDQIVEVIAVFDESQTKLFHELFISPRPKSMNDDDTVIKIGDLEKIKKDIIDHFLRIYFEFYSKY